MVASLRRREVHSLVCPPSFLEGNPRRIGLLGALFTSQVLAYFIITDIVNNINNKNRKQEQYIF